MNRFRRPSRSERWPKNNAPATSPSRYTEALPVTTTAGRFSDSGLVSNAAIELTTVISRPSSTQATPSAATNLV